MGHCRGSWPGVVNSTFVGRALNTRSAQAGKAHAHVGDFQATSGRLLLTDGLRTPFCSPASDLQSGFLCGRMVRERSTRGTLKARDLPPRPHRGWGVGPQLCLRALDESM